MEYLVINPREAIELSGCLVRNPHGAPITIQVDCFAVPKRNRRRRAQRALRWLRKNPKFREKFRAVTDGLKAAGRQRVSPRLIWETARDAYSMSADNAYSRTAARLLQITRPDLRGFFTLRKDAYDLTEDELIAEAKRIGLIRPKSQTRKAS